MEVLLKINKWLSIDILFKININEYFAAVKKKGIIDV